MRKKINSVLFFGGSNTQSSAMNQLKGLNYNIILIDRNKNCFCKKYCDHFINISHSEHKKIKKKIAVLKKNKLNKIKKYYGVSDLAFKTISNIFNIKEYEKFIYKKNTKEIIYKHLDTPKFFILGKKKDILKDFIKYRDKLKNFLHKLKSDKFLLKPSYGISSIGIEVLKKKKFSRNFDINFKRLVDKLDKENDYIVEDFISGKIINIDFIKKKQNYIFYPIIERSSLDFKNKKSLITALQYHSNLKINHKIFKKISDLFNKKFENYDGPVTLDCIINKKKIFIIEASPHFHNIKFLDYLFNIKAFVDIENQQKNKSIRVLRKNFYGGYCHFYKQNSVSSKIIKYLKNKNYEFFKDDFQNPGKKLFFKSLKIKKPNLSLLYYIVPNKKELNKVNKYIKKIYKSC